MTTAARRDIASVLASAHQCADCGWSGVKWVGRCPQCHSWGTVTAGSSATQPDGAIAGGTAQPMPAVDGAAATAETTGIGELDRVLGGGLVPGSAVLLAGEPGIGKSTLLLAAAARQAATGVRALYASAEESTAQVRRRAGRIGAVQPDLFLAAESDLARLLGHVDALRPDLLVVDSVQALTAGQVDGVPGGVTQVRAVVNALVRLAKQRGLATVLVGHVTKDGSVAGPRMLEHLVDVVLSFEGDRQSRLRLVRATKNRFGPVDEVGCFDLGESGLVEVPDPTGLFLSRHHEAVPGTCVTVTAEGRRPLLAEIQALVAPTTMPTTRLVSSGVESARVSMTLAVLDRRAGIRLSGSDVYVATVGGARVGEPSADLATAVAVASAARDVVLPAGLVAVGEVGLAGELRRAVDLDRRLTEAARLGFTQAIVPADLGDRPRPPAVSGMAVLDVPDLRSALRVLGLQ